MTTKTADEIFTQADARGLRRMLIVTAIALEMRAVRAHLEDLGDKTLKNDKIVEIGLFSSDGVECLVVVAESGAGNADAQAMVTSAARECGPFDSIFFVGVAGSRKADVPIGSVVASKLIYNPYSGKWEDGDFFARPHPLPGNRALVSLAVKVERDGKWQERIRPARRAQFPDQKDYPQPFPPGAFVAAIASIEAVSADKKGQLELTLKKHYGDSYAVEMEGFGILKGADEENTPAIVVRGISDMAGDDKDPVRDAINQPIAAAHAAAFVFELITLRMERYPTATLAREEPLPAIAPPPLQLTLPAGHESRRTNIAFSFAGSKDDFPPQLCEEITQSLRDYLGDQSITLERAEAGSFHMVFSLREGDAARVNEPALAKLLHSMSGFPLKSVLDEATFDRARKSRAMLERASRELLEWSRSLPDGTELTRPELQALLENVDKKEGTSTALLGDPGAGKSALLSAFAHDLRRRGTPFLAVKADLIDPSVADEEALRIALGLESKVTDLLSALSRMQPVVLIVDQLDALATYIDLKTGRLNVLLNIVRRLGGDDNIHIVLSSRTFEYEHDTRLKSVRAESLVLDLPPWSAVLDVLERHGVKAAGWPQDAQRLMRSPQTLKTFLSLIKQGSGDDFTNYQKLLDRLWSERILAEPEGGELASLVSAIAEDMANHENLWVPVARYAANIARVSTLKAAGILTDFSTDSKIGFTHQTLFEHALARSFAERSGRLSSYVLDRQASLFVRPKMWAGLSYLREVDPPTYASDLHAIWSTEDLRRHLRYLLVEFVGSQTVPLEEEVGLMERALASPSRRIALMAMVGSAGWFARFKNTAIREAMTNPEEEGFARISLIRAQQFDQECVLRLLSAVWIPSAAYDANVWAVLEETGRWTDAHLELGRTIIRRTEINDFTFEHTMATIGAGQPDVALKLTLERLDKQLVEAKAESARRASTQRAADEASLSYYLHGSPSEPFHKLLEKSDGYDMLDAIALKWPKLFLNLLWPWLDRALTALSDVEGERDNIGYAIPYGVDPRFDEENGRLGEHVLLAAFTTALVALATDDPAAFETWVREHQNDDFVPVQRMIAHTLAAHGAQFADLSLTYLLSDTRRLHLGDFSDGSGTTRRLVEAASPHWTDQEIEQFSQYIQNYKLPVREDREPEQRRRFLQAIDRLKLTILRALPKQRLPSEASQRVAEGVRRFGEGTSRSGIEGPHWIGSPMSAEAMSKAKDAEIINAFKELPDATGWDHPKDWMKGGNIQLSREFGSFAKAHPDRAFQIIAKLEPSFGTRASAYALEALGEVADPVPFEDALLSLVARGATGEEFHNSVARGLEKLLTRDLPVSDVIVDLLKRWLSPFENAKSTEDAPDDEESLLDTGDDINKEATREESILWGMGGFSVLPSGNYPVLEVVTRVYLQRRDPDTLVSLLRGHLAVTEDIKVWTALLRFMQYVRPADPTEFRAFLNDLFDRHKGIETTREAAILVAHLHWQIPDFVREVLERWDSYSDPLVQQARGEVASLISIAQPELEWANTIVNTILLHGPPEAVTGVAYAAVNMWPDAEKRAAALAILHRAIPKADDRTWFAILDLFRIVDEIDGSPEWISFLESIAAVVDKHPSIPSTFIVDRLQTLLPVASTLVGRIALSLVGRWKSELGDIRTATASSAAELVDIAITLHRLGSATREAGTALFEDLLEVNAYTARETLDQIDNRFRGAAPTQRSRLPRRVRKSSRLRRS